MPVMKKDMPIKMSLKKRRQKDRALSASTLRAGVLFRRVVIKLGLSLACPLSLMQGTRSFAAEVLTNMPPANVDGVTRGDLRLGPFDLQPRAAVGMTYDDNIVLTSHDKQSDVISTVNPSLVAIHGDHLAVNDYIRENYNNYNDFRNFSPDRFVIKDPALWPERTLIMKYGPSLNLFAEHQAYNSIDELASFNLLWPLTQLLLGVRQDYQLQNTALIEAGRRTGVTTLATELTAGYQFSPKSSLAVSLNRDETGYEEVRDLKGYTDWHSEGWFNYQATALLNLSIGGKLGWEQVFAQRDQNYEQLLARGRYRIGERLEVDASCGFEARQFQSDGSETVEPVLSIGAHYQPFDRTTFALTAYEREQSSLFFGYNYLEKGVSGSLYQTFLDRYTLHLAT